MKKSLFLIATLSLLACVSTSAMSSPEGSTAGGYTYQSPVKKKSAKKSVSAKNVDKNQPVPTEIKVGLKLKQVARMEGVEFRVSLSAKGYMLNVAHNGKEWYTNVSWNSEKGLTAAGKKKLNSVEIPDDYTVVQLAPTDFNNLAKIDGEW